MSIEQRIQQLARQGYSKRHAAELLGFSRVSFEAALAVMEPIEWAGNGRSVAAKAGNESRRGKFTESQARALELAAEARKAANRRTVRNTTGTIGELVKAFLLPIAACTVRRRMAKGESLESALFGKPKTRRGASNASGGAR